MPSASFFLASRVSGTLVEYFCYQLKRLGKDASVIDENNLIWESIELMDPKKIGNIHSDVSAVSAQSDF